MGVSIVTCVMDRSRLIAATLLCAVLFVAPACTPDNSDPEKNSTSHSDDEMAGMSHDDELTPEMIEFIKSVAPNMVDSSDEEIGAMLKMMPPNYDWYVSDEGFSDDIGVLVATHGFGEAGDKIFAESLAPVATVHPTAVAFGMAMMTSAHFQSAVDDLVTAGAKTIVAIPATQSKFDTGIRQYQYIMGHRDEPSYMAVPVVNTSARILFTPPLSDHPLVSEILLDFATELSTDQKSEVVIIVGHGPAGEEDNTRELEMVGHHVDYIRNNSEFAAVRIINLQDDAADATRAANVESLRGLAEAAIQEGNRVLIVGFLLGTGGIQPRIEKDLEGLDYQFNLKGLSEHQNFNKWVAQMVSDATEG